MLRAGFAVCGSGSSRTARPCGARIRAGGIAALGLAGLSFAIALPAKIQGTMSRHG
jgi:hypothetical protein